MSLEVDVPALDVPALPPPGTYSYQGIQRHAYFPSYENVYTVTTRIAAPVTRSGGLLQRQVHEGGPPGWNGRVDDRVLWKGDSVLHVRRFIGITGETCSGDPPLTRYAWPFSDGQTWVNHYVCESERGSNEYDEEVAVLGQEVIDVGGEAVSAWVLERAFVVTLANGQGKRYAPHVEWYRSDGLLLRREHRREDKPTEEWLIGWRPA